MLAWRYFIAFHALSGHTLTTDDVQGTEGDVAEAVERTSPGLRVQLLHQDLGLLVHHLQEVRQDGEVEGGRQHLPPLAPLIPSADREEEEKNKSVRGFKAEGQLQHFHSSKIFVNPASDYNKDVFFFKKKCVFNFGN